MVVYEADAYSFEYAERIKIHEKRKTKKNMIEPQPIKRKFEAKQTRDPRGKYQIKTGGIVL